MQLGTLHIRTRRAIVVIWIIKFQNIWIPSEGILISCLYAIFLVTSDIMVSGGKWKGDMHITCCIENEYCKLIIVKVAIA
jgi:hypothetical protein